jgi:ribosome recycling factor
VSEITEDDLKIMLDDVQELTDTYIGQIDEMMAKKEQELMQV